MRHMDLCTGRGEPDGTHCCFIAGTPCPYLVENQAGRRYACGLMVELETWDTVEADPRYQPIAAAFGSASACRDWQPRPGDCCRKVRDGDLGT